MNKLAFFRGYTEGLHKISENTTAGGSQDYSNAEESNTNRVNPAPVKQPTVRQQRARGDADVVNPSPYTFSGREYRESFAPGSTAKLNWPKPSKADLSAMMSAEQKYQRSIPTGLLSSWWAQQHAPLPEGGDIRPAIPMM